MLVGVGTGIVNVLVMVSITVKTSVIVSKPCAEAVYAVTADEVGLLTVLLRKDVMERSDSGPREAMEKVVETLAVGVYFEVIGMYEVVNDGVEIPVAFILTVEVTGISLDTVETVDNEVAELPPALPTELLDTDPGAVGVAVIPFPTKQSNSPSCVPCVFKSSVEYK